MCAGVHVCVCVCSGLSRVVYYGSNKEFRTQGVTGMGTGWFRVSF